MTTERASAGNTISSKCAVIEVRVTELRQLFNAIDPSPFLVRDLDPKAEEFIVGWSKDYPPAAKLALLIYLDRPAGLPNEAAVLQEAIHEYFSQRALATRRRLRQLFSIGRTSLAIGLAFLALSIVAGDFVASRLKGGGIVQIVRESFLIGGWVAMWRPIQIFLYDWWPIRREAKNYDRLATMPVQIKYMNDASPDAWRRDWPAVPDLPKQKDASPPPFQSS
ncbi:MAG: hypothetical protein CXZ00_15900 [Acidobacteria bacterium]|nr:MAG: hypothetical protein CXZ00_15900 [Acidobacteriota bacterium]